MIVSGPTDDINEYLTIYPAPAFISLGHSREEIMWQVKMVWLFIDGEPTFLYRGISLPYKANLRDISNNCLCAIISKHNILIQWIDKLQKAKLHCFIQTHIYTYIYIHPVFETSKCTIGIGCLIHAIISVIQIASKGLCDTWLEHI